jgi:nucleoside-diphosphate-sugar epimerase
MKIFLTGAFGNIGRYTLEELLRRNHYVICFDIRNKKNEKIFSEIKHRFKNNLEVFWGDLRKIDDLEKAIPNDIDAVVHLAFIIPKLSSTGIESEKAPELSRKINVGGTENLVNVLKKKNRNVKIIFTSSLHIYGRTQDKEPPRKVWEIPEPIEHYSFHKIECENIIKNSGLSFCIFRLSAVLPINIRLDKGMFDVPLENRFEFVHVKDVATAIANALENNVVWGKVLHIGGGKRCQLYYKDIVEKVLKTIGIGMLPEDAFTNIPFPIDWLDTEESQKLLFYQKRTFEDYLMDMKKALGLKIYIIKAFKHIIRMWLLSHSPYYKERKFIKRLRIN